MNRYANSAVGTAAAVLIAATPPLHAATVDACGPTVCYQYDDAQSAFALWGTPTLVGDDLRFLPMAQQAQTTGGPGAAGGRRHGHAFGSAWWSAATFARGDADISSVTVIIDRIWSPTGATIGEISATTVGHWRTAGQTGVSADLSLLVASNTSGAFAVDDDTFSSGAPAGWPATASRRAAAFTPWGTDRGHWTLTAGLLPGSVFDDGASDVAVSLQQTLMAWGHGAGFIQAQAGFLVSAATVPLPASGWLLLGACAALWRRSTRSA